MPPRRLGEFNTTWSEKYPAVVRLWENARTEFAPFLDYGPRSEARGDVVAGPVHRLLVEQASGR